jgi:peptidyl-prolyl cis-trans isomerase SurA
LLSVLACSSSNEGDDTAGAAAAGSESPGSGVAPDAESRSGDPELSAAHILIMYEGSARAPAEITRSKQEALEVATSVAKQAQAPGADFAMLARVHSNGPSAPQGGDLGIFPASQMIPEFSVAVMKLQIGEVSDPIETPFGYHIILRQPISKASAKHILIMYAGSELAGSGITRTKEEAYGRAQEVLTRVRAGEEFEALAREYSDGPSAPKGGDLGEFNKGSMTPAFDTATFACKVGEVTDIVETPFGYHIIYRYK